LPIAVACGKAHFQCGEECKSAMESVRMCGSDLVWGIQCPVGRREEIDST
jgi:hypothetical protein